LNDIPVHKSRLRAIEEAAEWRARIDSGRADLPAFERWRADPYNAAAYARILGTWRDAGDVAPTASVRTPKPPISRRAVLMAAAGLAAAGVSGTFWYARPRPTQVVTAIGESRTLVLDDNVRVQLNTDTFMRWHKGAEGIILELLRGEIAVTLGQGSLTLRTIQYAAVLLEGLFNLRLDSEALDLTVMTGRARLGNRRHSATTDAHTGQRLRATNAGITLSSVSPDQILALAGWQKGEIVLLDAPLSAAVNEYNRYLSRKLIIGDTRIAALRVGGRFNASDPESFLNALEASLSVKATPSAEGIILKAV
jgi:transmembrane sensor